MANNRSQELLKFANLQMAAEAFLDGFDENTPVDTFAQALENGNGHASAFPPILASDFANEWIVVDHQGAERDDGRLVTERGTAREVA